MFILHATNKPRYLLTGCALRPGLQLNPTEPLGRHQPRNAADVAVATMSATSDLQTRSGLTRLRVVGSIARREYVAEAG